MSALSSESLDPPQDVAQGLQYFELIFDWLVGINEDNSDISEETGAAESWEASADGLLWTFKIRPGIQFADDAGGLTSADVKFSLERNMAESSLMGFAATMRTRIASIDAPAPDTVIISLKQPWTNLPYALSPVLGLEGVIVPKAYVEEVGADGFAAAPIGSGPYQVESQTKGVSLTLVPNPDWRGDTPRYTEIEFRIIPEGTSRLAALERGDVDVAELSYDLVSRVEGGDLEITARPVGRTIVMNLFQMYGDTPLANAKVRQALNLAIDREAIAEALFAGIAEPISGYYVAGRSSYGGIPDLAPYPFDPDRAKELLAEAGYPNGFQIEIRPQDQGGFTLGPLNEAVAGYFEDIGLTVNLAPTDYNTILADYRAGALANVVSAWVAPDRLFPDGAVVAVYGRGSPVNETQQDEELMNLVAAELQAATNLDEYGTAIAAIQQHLYDNYQTLSLVYAPELWASQPGAVPGDWTAGNLAAWSKGIRELAFSE